MLDFFKDIEGILPVGLPVFCRGITPNSPVRNGPGTVGLPVILGGQQVCAGDLVAGDRNGVVVVPYNKIEDTLNLLDNHEYGYCEACGVEIGIRRLEARPTATLCIDCKTLDEIREKQMG